MMPFLFVCAIAAMAVGSLPMAGLLFVVGLVLGGNEYAEERRDMKTASDRRLRRETRRQ